MKRYFLAFDLGAESGRAVLGTLEKDKLRIQEIYRFPNSYINLQGCYHWDAFMLFIELKRSLCICAQNFTNQLESMAIDTWGVDFGLLSSDGSLLSLPYSYRDSRTNGMVEDFAREVMPTDRLYKLTGIQTMQINTLFQLYALKKSNPAMLSAASALLFMPDLFNYLFTGEKFTEYSIASTSQLLDPFTRQWNCKLFEAAGLPVNIMQKLIPQGQIIGNVDEVICTQAGLTPFPVLSVASHDTGSAIASIPADSENWAYLSSGTWSLMGLELKQPIVTDESSAQNFTNEVGVDGTYRFLKNMNGMWLLQQCKKVWDIQTPYTYDDLVQIAANAEPFRILIDTEAPEFLNPDDMPSAINTYCIKTGQPLPSTHAEFVRCIFDSLAMKYRLVMKQLEAFSPVPIHKLFVIGGGSKNKLLCQLTANALSMPVVTGPSEATAVGNILVQAKAMGYVLSLNHIREIVRNSFESTEFLPADSFAWEVQEHRMLEIIEKHNLF